MPSHAKRRLHNNTGQHQGAEGSAGEGQGAGEGAHGGGKGSHEHTRWRRTILTPCVAQPRPAGVWIAPPRGDGTGPG
jgi:hypothetical protein